MSRGRKAKVRSNSLTLRRTRTPLRPPRGQPSLHPDRGPARSLRATPSTPTRRAILDLGPARVDPVGLTVVPAGLTVAPVDPAGLTVAPVDPAGLTVAPVGLTVAPVGLTVDTVGLAVDPVELMVVTVALAREGLGGRAAGEGARRSDRKSTRVSSRRSCAERRPPSGG